MAVRKTCQTIVLRCRSGGMCDDGMYLAMTSGGHGNFAEFFTRVCDHWRLGITPVPAMSMVIDVINRNMMFVDNSTRLATMNKFRGWIALIIALSGRVIIAESPRAIGVLSREDAICWLSALAIHVLTLRIHTFIAPPCWLTNNEVKPWLNGIAGHHEGDHELATQMRHLEAEELRLGCSYAAQREEILRDWAQARDHEQNLRFDRYTDLMPLMDLLGLGLPILLLLAVPFIDRL